ncbi:amidohydrolase [Caballeronia sp. LjRoot34]|jgi:predicted amidohydrolase
MIENLRVAAVQFEPSMFAKDANLDALAALVEEAAQGGARLITVPEMATTGYCWVDREEVAPFVEIIPGPTTDRFGAIAKQYDCHVVIGMPERDADTDLYYNSAVLIGPDGVVGVHRKTHPYISEPRWAASGDYGHQVFATPIGRIALLICMDIHFVETARLVALDGAEIICHISNWLAERTPAPYWISRAAENGCFLIESNRWGLERGVQFSGGSCVIDQNGKVLASRDDGDGIVFARLTSSPMTADSPRAAFERRRPDKYLQLMTNPFTWNPLEFLRLYGISPLSAGQSSKVMVVQLRRHARTSVNLDQIEAVITKVMEHDKPSLIVFPELSMSGFEGTVPVAEPVPGAATDRLVRLAMRHGVYLVAGMAEAAGEARFNCAVLAGPEGLIGSYRKIHLHDEDLPWASMGDSWRTFDTAIGRIGILIGYDALFPESARVLALSGCDVIACPSALAGRFTGTHPGSAIRQSHPIPVSADPFHWHHFRVRAGENNVYFAYANRFDPESGRLGESGVFGPDTFAFPRREALVHDDEATATLLIDTGNLDTPYPTNVVRNKDLLKMRLPHHYAPLIKQ